MTSMKRKIAAMLAAVTLMTVGATAAMAEYGDTDRDTGDQPRYKVGQEVEVYNSPLHITTKRTTILSATKEDGHWTYKIDMSGIKMSQLRPVLVEHKQIGADDIEAPKN